MPRRSEIIADASLERAKQTSPTFKALLEQSHHGHGGSVREDHYKGHHIVIRTTYEIEIDGKPFHGELDVSNAGTVQYHGIPNVSSNSAIDLIRAVIDSFPDDFEGAGADEGAHHRHASRSAAPTEVAGGGPARKARGGSAAKARAGRARSAGATLAREKPHARSRKHSH